MPPQFKYALVGLVILNLCVLIFVFSGNSDQPVKQAAVQPQVAAPPPAQPPVQTTVYQPPVQQPVPTQEQLQQQRAKEECAQKQTHYTHIFLTDGLSRLKDIYAKGGGQPLEDLLQDMRNYRARWEVEKRGCLQVPGWQPTLTDDEVNRVLRTDCLQRSNNYAWFFDQMQNMHGLEKERFLESKVPTNELPHRQFVANWRALDRQCSQDLPRWVTPPATRQAYERQASNP